MKTKTIGILSILLFSSLPGAAARSLFLPIPYLPLCHTKLIKGELCYVRKTACRPPIRNQRSDRIIKKCPIMKSTQKRKHKTMEKETQKLLRKDRQDKDFHFRIRILTAAELRTYKLKDIPKIADTLSKAIDNLEMKKDIEKTLSSRNTRINNQLKQLADKVNEHPGSLHKEDLKTVIELAVHLRFTTAAPANPHNPVASNVMRDLAENAYDIVTSWEIKPQSRAIALISAFNQNTKKGMRREHALNKAFRTVENIVLTKDIRKRKKEIRAACSKGNTFVKIEDLQPTATTKKKKEIRTSCKKGDVFLSAFAEK